jgi:hypothetical protein
MSHQCIVGILATVFVALGAGAHAATIGGADVVGHPSAAARCEPRSGPQLTFSVDRAVLASLFDFDSGLAYALYEFGRLSRRPPGMSVDGGEVVVAAIPTRDSLLAAMEGRRLTASDAQGLTQKQHLRFQLVPAQTQCSAGAVTYELRKTSITEGSSPVAAVRLTLAPGAIADEYAVKAWAAVSDRVVSSAPMSDSRMAPIHVVVSEDTLDRLAALNPLASMVLANMAGLQELEPGRTPRTGQSLSSRGVTSESARVRRRRDATELDVLASTYGLPEGAALVTSWFFSEDASGPKLVITTALHGATDTATTAPFPSVEVLLARRRNAISFDVIQIRAL